LTGRNEICKRLLVMAFNFLVILTDQPRRS
jgi:hypothetical protein